MIGALQRMAVPALERLACWRPASRAVSAWQGWRGVQRFSVLTYHRIGGERDAFFTGIAVADFAAQMRALARHCRVLPVGELLQRASARELPPAAVGVTFDDSYASVHEIAWPIMRDLGLRGTVFVPTAPLIGGEPLWYDRVIHAFKHTTTTRLHADALPALASAQLTDPATRVRLAEAALDSLRRMEESERDAAVRRLEQALRPCHWRHEPALGHGTLEQLRRHAAEGLDVGAHSISHPIFARLSPLRARGELRESRGQLEGWLQRRVDLLAYPNGRADDIGDDTVREVEDAGYRAAFTTEPGINDDLWSRDRFRLRRIDAAGTRAGRLLLRLSALRLVS